MDKEYIENQIYKFLNESEKVNGVEKLIDRDTENIVGVIKSMDAKGIIKYCELVDKKIKITEEGKEIIEKGSYEYRLAKLVKDNGINIKDLRNNDDNSKIYRYGLGGALKKKWVIIKDGIIKKGPLYNEDILDYVKNDLLETLKDQKLKLDLVKREYVKLKKNLTYEIWKGPKFEKKGIEIIPDLTIEHLKDFKWRELSYKTYNLESKGLEIDKGSIHPLTKVKDEFSKIFLEMGFEEIKGDSYVESSFWNFDALYQPQNHPARDLHDTFFLSQPKISKKIPEDYSKTLGSVHRFGESIINEGSDGSGYGYIWSKEEAMKNVLRTHNTSLTARVLYKYSKELKNGASYEPKKFFSIDRVFRNESIDATHLPEFHQIEGIIVGKNLGIHNLMWVIQEFYKKIGIFNIKFKITYNPYTEPSLEIYSYHKELDQWIEVGNSGVFRPEMIRAMGFPPDFLVLGWGLSLERPAMIIYGIKNIRGLMGDKVNIEDIKNSPICKLKKAYS